MLADIKAGKINAVIAWHPDRLHRPPLELERYISVCEKHGVENQTVYGGMWDLSTPSGRMTARVSRSVARYEWNTSRGGCARRVCSTRSRASITAASAVTATPGGQAAAQLSSQRKPLR